MRKCMSWLLLLAMLMIALGMGYAEEAGASHFILAGYDQEATNHVWETNEFFQRMEERTGIDFTYDQYVSAEKWAQAKVQILNGTYEMMPDVLTRISSMLSGDRKANAAEETADA